MLSELVLVVLTALPSAFAPTSASMAPFLQETTPETADRERAKKLLEALDQTLAKTNSAHERVGRVGEVLKEIEQIQRESGEANNDAAIIQATQELTATLKSHIDKLYVDALGIRDAVQRDVIPEQSVTIERIRSRIDLMDPNHPDYREVEQIYETARVQRTQTEEQVQRLERSVQALGAVRNRLSDRMRVIDLWKQVNLKGDELLKKLNEFNRKVEEIAKELNPIQA